MIITLARMSGEVGTNEEIYAKFQKNYEIVKQMEPAPLPTQMAKAEIVNRPF